ncbi:MAG: ASPIC/UnbV domain-containing protein [Planctomycetota bacterium]|nr:ASPIC/UnbV domain-containing protein [Planctomycetota bacterium]
MVRGDKETKIKRGQEVGVVIDPGQIGSGASFSGAEPNHFWLNIDGKEFSTQSGISGADHKGDGRAIALFDYDRDGYQDFVLVGGNRPYVQLYRNKIGDLMPSDSTYQPIYIRLVGGNKTSSSSTEWTSRDGIGAKVVLESGDLNISRELRCGEGLAAQNSSTMPIGIGDNKSASFVVKWPTGKITAVAYAAPGQVITVYENPADAGNSNSFVVSSISRVAKGVAQEVLAAKTHDDAQTSQLLLDMSAPYTKAKYRLFTTWFTTCVACKAAGPKIDAISKHFDDVELQVLGFNNDPGDDKADMAKYMKVYNPSYVMMTERSDDEIDMFKEEQDRLTPKYELNGEEELASILTPSVMLIDDKGLVVFTDIGVPTYSKLKQVILEWEGRTDF